MTVKELKEILDHCKDGDIVIVSKDGEGNEYSPLIDVSLDVYIADSTWSGSIKSRKLTDEMKRSGFSKEDVAKENEGMNCVTLWPTN